MNTRVKELKIMSSCGIIIQANVIIVNDKSKTKYFIKLKGVKK